MQPFESQLPSREAIVIPEDQVTPQMRANAIGSPDNVHPGAFKPEMAPAAEKEVSHVAEAAGSAATRAAVEVTEPSNEYDALFNVADTEEKVDATATAYRPTKEQGDAIRQSVAKNIDLVQKYGSTYVNTPENK